jgi:hypothetical protein
MSGDFALDTEFEAIMAAGRNQLTPHRPAKAVPSNSSSVTPSGGGYGPSRTPRSERVPPLLGIQAVCFHSISRFFLQITIDASHTKKYDTIVKGFKILEASYQESQRKLTVTEEQLSTIRAPYNTLIVEMEAVQRVLRDRETVRQRIFGWRTLIKEDVANPSTARGCRGQQGCPAQS